jgi:hypothetical protein
MTTAHKANLALLIAETSRRGEGREALEVLSPATSTPIVAPPVANPAMPGEKHRGQASGAACHRVSEQQRQDFCPSRCPTSGGGAAVLHIAELRGGKARRAGLWHQRISGDNRRLSSARSARRITSAPGWFSLAAAPRRSPCTLPRERLAKRPGLICSR